MRESNSWIKIRFITTTLTTIVYFDKKAQQLAQHHALLEALQTKSNYSATTPPTWGRVSWGEVKFTAERYSFVEENLRIKF